MNNETHTTEQAMNAKDLAEAGRIEVANAIYRGGLHTVDCFAEAVQDARHFLGMATATTGWALNSQHANKGAAFMSATEDLRDMADAIDKAEGYAVAADDFAIVEGLRSAARAALAEAKGLMTE